MTTKYRAKKTLSPDGILFDSKREARRWKELNLMLRAGLISDLRRQVKYILIPIQREPDRVGKRGGKIQGHLLEREVDYVADFVYRDKNGNEVVEDSKGVRTKDFVIKRKLMLWVHGIKVREV